MIIKIEHGGKIVKINTRRPLLLEFIKTSFLAIIRTKYPKAIMCQCPVCGKTILSITGYYSSQFCKSCYKTYAAKKRRICSICGGTSHDTKSCPRLKCEVCSGKIKTTSLYKMYMFGATNGRVCSNCVGKCKICGKTFLKTYFWQSFCPECNTVDLKKFNGKNSLLMLRSPSGGGTAIQTGSWRPFSVELESYALNERAFNTDLSSKTISQATDSSITEHGYGTREFRLGPYYGDYGLKLLSDDVSKIRTTGWRADDSCGLHIHIDAQGFNEACIKNICKTFYYYQKVLYSLTNIKRSTNQYCAFLPSEELPETGRRYGFNSTAMSRHGTIEYRFVAGMTNPARVIQWVKLLLAFSEFASKNNEFISFQEIIGSSHDIEYWNKIHEIEVARAKKLNLKPVYEGNLDFIPKINIKAGNFLEKGGYDTLDKIKLLKKEIRAYEKELKEMEGEIFTFES